MMLKNTILTLALTWFGIVGHAQSIEKNGSTFLGSRRKEKL